MDICPEKELPFYNYYALRSLPQGSSQKRELIVSSGKRYCNQLKVATSYAVAYGFILLSVSAISSFATARS
jgi:hypothetical protein